jgi:DNA-binding transcriptional ArsR family regulator
VASLKSVAFSEECAPVQGSTRTYSGRGGDVDAGRLLDNFRPVGKVKQVLNYSGRLDAVYAALSDGSRRAIVDRLSRGPASVKELAEPLTMSLPAVLQHLRVLQESGLVQSQKVGRVRTCRLEPAVLQQAVQWLADRRALWADRLDRLEEFLDSSSSESEGDQQ